MAASKRGKKTGPWKNKKALELLEKMDPLVRAMV